LEHRFLTYKNSQVSWYRFGSGLQPVICFHGYGESGNHFGFLEQSADQQFSFFAIDLPFHGETEWNEGLDFECEDLKEIIDALLASDYDKQEILNYKPILLGFSLGGRISLSLYQAIPGKIEKVVLLAPDGLKINFWYWLGTQTWAGRKLFYFTMQNPGWFFGFLKILKSIGFVNSSVFKFVKYYIDNKTVRHELYNRWITFRNLSPDLSKIKLMVLKHKTPFRLVYGKHDRIILPEHGGKFRKGIEMHCNVSVIESGHQVLHEKHVNDIVSQLKS
jgi:pimeloyl-ACP methyl ester carboxylesterase